MRSRKIRILTNTAAAVAVLVSLAGVAGPAAAREANPLRGPFGAQAAAAGLDQGAARVLQAQVDALILAEGGTQIAVNRIRWANGLGDTTLPLPGERVARTIGALSSNCDYLYLCLYTAENFYGTRYSLYYCVDYYTPYRFFSYKNNQTAGTVARFEDSAGRAVDYTPGAYSSRVWYNSAGVSFVQPC